MHQNYVLNQPFRQYARAFAADVFVVEVSCMPRHQIGLRLMHDAVSLLSITVDGEFMQALDAAEEEEKSAEANFQLLGSQDVPPPPDIGDNLTITPAEMTVAALQEALSKRGLDTKWNPLKSKKELVDRLQVSKASPCHSICRWIDVLGGTLPRPVLQMFMHGEGCKLLLRVMDIICYE